MDSTNRKLGAIGGEQRDETIEVLYVGEEPNVALASDLSDSEGETISIATEVEPLEALDRLEREQFDCVVSHYRPPEVDGIELLRAVRDQHPELPFLLLTDKESEAVTDRAMAAGATRCLRIGDRDGGDGAAVTEEIRSAVAPDPADQFGALLESIPDAVVVIDLDGVVDQVNSRTESLFGYDRDELIGEPVEALLPDRHRGPHVVHREQYVQDPETRPMGADADVYALRKDGSEVPVDVSLGPIRVDGERKVMATVRDVSARRWRDEELRERERDLQRKNERLDEFVSVVSHDLQNPLTVASGCVELARETGDLDHLESAEQALDRMQTLVDDLLTLSREGTTVDELQPVSLLAAAEMSWTTAETADATLHPPDDATLLADEGRLRQVFENLFHNCVEHGSPGTGDGSDDAAVATVRVGQLSDGFYVADDGPGIPEEEREAVFEYGYSTSEDGNGVGLAIVESIVEAHGWEIRITDSADGGARFEITGVDWVD